MARKTRASAHLDQVAAATVRNSGVFAHKLPFELVLDILLQSLADLERHDERVRFLQGITAVSSWWRTFAVTMPELWSEIVYPKRFDKKDFDAVFHRIKTYLERSKNSPISVSVFTQGTTLKDSRRLLNLIIPQLPRCHTLSLQLHVPTLVEQYLPLRGPLPLLRKANIAAWLLEGWSTPGHHVVSVFSEDNASPLRELQLSSNKAFGLSDIPASALKRVDLQGNDAWEDVTTFLGRCLDLEHLTLDYLTRPEDDEITAMTTSPRTNLTLAHLQSVALTGRVALGLGAFMVMPNLERLSLATEMRTYEVFDPFDFSVQAPPIRTLYLRDFVFPMPPTLRSLMVFELYNAIRILELESCSNVKFVIFILKIQVGTAEGPTGTMMLPELELLRVYLDTAQLAALRALLAGLLDQRTSLCLALKCSTPEQEPEWDHEYEELKQSHGDRVTRWDMVPHVL